MVAKIADKAAIVGIGATEFSKDSGRSELSLAAEAVMVTTVASVSSTTLVETVLVVVRASKLPPLVPVMALVMVSVPCT